MFYPSVINYFDEPAKPDRTLDPEYEPSFPKVDPGKPQIPDQVPDKTPIEDTEPEVNPPTPTPEPVPVKPVAPTIIKSYILSVLGKISLGRLVIS